MFFAPAYAAVKLIATFTVRLFPETLTEDAPALITHWLFCNVPVTPTGIGVSQVPASLARKISLKART